MSNFIVSCYYWPTVEGRLRLRALIIKEQRGETGSGLNYTPLGRLTTMDKIASSVERRRMRRLRAKCEVELTTSLSLLDNDVKDSESSLLLLGRTHDLSAGGLGMILPSTTIDERFCTGANHLTLSLFVPGGVVDLEVSPVRCERLKGPYFGQGYLLGTKITNVKNRERFEQYLDLLSHGSQGVRGQSVDDRRKSFARGSFGE